MTSFFVLKNRRREKFCRVAGGELGKLPLMFPHKVHDVTQTLNIELIASQHIYHNLTQMLDDDRIVDKQLSKNLT